MCNSPTCAGRCAGAPASGRTRRTFGRRERGELRASRRRELKPAVTIIGRYAAGAASCPWLPARAATMAGANCAQDAPGLSGGVSRSKLHRDPPIGLSLPRSPAAAPLPPENEGEVGGEVRVCSDERNNPTHPQAGTRPGAFDTAARVLAVGAAANVFGRGPPVTYEDPADGQRQLLPLAALDFPARHASAAARPSAVPPRPTFAGSGR